MEFDEMIMQRLSHDTELAAILATFNGFPAVFSMRAPPPERPEWKDKIQYPRLDFTLDYQGDPARQTSGRLTINIWSDAEIGIAPEVIDLRLRRILHASFAQADDYPYCLAWMRSDAFEGNDERTIGITVTFDMVAFPPQLTFSPDPIKAMNDWTKEVIHDAIVIGKDSFDGWYTPSKEKPVVFWRLASQSVHEKRIHVETWFNVTIEGHVYAINAADRLYILSAVNTAAGLAHHVTMEDKSPLFIRDISIRPHLSFLAPGQILINGRFGVLQPKYANPPDQPPLKPVLKDPSMRHEKE